MKAERRFQFVANQLAVDFANTVIRENASEVDLLEDVSALLDWLVLADIISAKQRQRLERRISGAGECEALLREAWTLRSAMLILVNSATERKRIPESLLSEINRVLALAPTRRRVVRTAAAFEVEINGSS
jgi:predicted RNA-binding Zn ribbon-like protein